MQPPRLGHNLLTPETSAMKERYMDTASDHSVLEPAPAEFRAVPLRHPWRWLATAGIAVLVAMAVHFAVTNPGWRWHVVWHYLFSRPVLEGLGRTLLLTASAIALGLVVGTLLAVMRL